LIDVAVFSSASNTVEHVSSGSELLLTDVSLSDTGTYMCTASNRQGSATARVTVTVTGQPAIFALSSCFNVLLAVWYFCSSFIRLPTSMKTHKNIAVFVAQHFSFVTLNHVSKLLNIFSFFLAAGSFVIPVLVNIDKMSTGKQWYFVTP